MFRTSSSVRTILRAAQRSVQSSSSRQLSTLRSPLRFQTSRLPITTTATRTFSHTTRTMGVHNIEKTGHGLDWSQAKEESKDKVMVVDAFATWCGPCKAIAPTVVKYSDKYPDANFYKLDVDEFPSVAEELEIRAMPTFIVFVKGEKQPLIVGANPKALEDAIVKALEKVQA